MPSTLFAAVFVACTLVATTTAVLPAMYVFGDIHLDPYYGTAMAISDNLTCRDTNLPPIPSTGCDTSPALMESAIADIFRNAAVDGNGVMLLTGDFLRHRMVDFDVPNENGTAKHIVEYELAHNITLMIGRTIQKYQALYPNRVHVVAHPNFFSLVFGNEDCVPNYKFNATTNASMHAALPYLASGLVETGVITPEQGAVLQQCAFYAVNPPGTNLYIIALNTVIYSKDHTGTVDNSSDPCGQLAWLEGELNLAVLRNWRVMILGHIIPEATKWVPAYLETFRDMMKSYSNTISVQWFGHTHMFTFMAESKHLAPPLFDVPGITPRDGNMPSYLRVTFQDQIDFSNLNTSQWLVSTITEHYMDVSNPPASTDLGWQAGLTFPTDFPEMGNPITTKALYEYGKYLIGESDSSNAWLTFQQMYRGGVVMTPMKKKDKNELLCKAIEHNEADYEKCKKDNE